VNKLKKDKGSFEEKVEVANVIVCLRFLCNCINQPKVIVLGEIFVEVHCTKVVQGGEIISDVVEDDNDDDVEEEKEINYDDDEK